MHISLHWLPSSTSTTPHVPTPPQSTILKVMQPRDGPWNPHQSSIPLTFLVPPPRHKHRRCWLKDSPGRQKKNDNWQVRHQKIQICLTFSPRLCFVPIPWNKWEKDLEKKTVNGISLWEGPGFYNNKSPHPKFRDQCHSWPSTTVDWHIM